MTILERLPEAMREPLLWLFATAAIIAVGVTTRWLLSRRYGKVAGWRFRLQLTTFGLLLAGLLGVILFLPDKDLREQLLTLMGVLLTAAIALSSTTLLGNAMAGLMLRGVGGFRGGDFVRVEGHFGRVTEQGLFHTEIQTEDRDLITLPNLYLAAHPLRVLRRSGTIVSASVSLGYDVPRTEARDLLLEGAEAAGLEEPFVQVMELGDFSVTYRVAGLLTEVKQVLTARSALRARMLDCLHKAGVEIVSPTFMNQRVLDPAREFIPETDEQAEEETTPLPEGVMFDKAEHAATKEKLRQTYEEIGSDVAVLEERIGAAESEEERLRLEERAERRRGQRERVGEILKQWEERKPEH